MDDMENEFGIVDANEDFEKFLAPGEKFEDYDTNGENVYIAIWRAFVPIYVAIVLQINDM